MSNNGTMPIPSVDDELYPALIQCFFIIFVGYVGGQINLLTEAHSIGLSRYISNFALPAVIFQNLVNLHFEHVSWRFLISVLIAKTIMFFVTMLMSCIAERPRNFAVLGQYSIMTTQSNDFALILPIINAVYRQSHPEFGSYIYLIAPISLVILNPIGFFLIEMQKRIDDQKKHRHYSWSRCQLISAVFRNIIQNPIVICTFLGLLFNQIFRQALPPLLDYVFTPIAQSFSATALFYLGLSMVGKLNRLHTHLVVTVFLLSMMKLIVFPLLLRQAVFFMVKPVNDSLNVTIDYSNMGFLYGTAPIAPSVVFYVPESNLLLQATTSTSLVVSTLLAAPIMLISAKMISIRTLDVKATEIYEQLLTKTAYDVSLLSFVCTVIVLLGFCLRRHSLRNLFIHKYTFIFVGLQMIHAFWTIAIHHIQQPLSPASSAVVDIGFILIALTTRTWVTSLALILMITICHTTSQAQKYFWLYHLLGWLVPLCLSLGIYFGSTIDRTKEQPTIGAEKFGKIQLILSIILLATCILINCVSLLRIARRTYRLKQNTIHNRESTDVSNEGRPLIIEEDGDISPNLPEPKSMAESDTQLFRHGILVAFLTVDAFICLAALLWLLLVHNRDGIYYELQFLDTVLLHGQGIISFLIFALDTDFLVPMIRMLVKIFHIFTRNRYRWNDEISARSINNDEEQEFECKMRPDFVRHCLTAQNINSSKELVFNGSDFCQWLITTGYVANELTGKSFIQRLISNKKLICISRNLDDFDMELSTHWYAFTRIGR